MSMVDNKEIGCVVHIYVKYQALNILTREERIYL